MLPLNPWMLLGLAGVAIPILIHILTRQTGQRLDWAAIQFLRDSLVIRNRRIHLEEALLMAARCLLVVLFALALARPFVPPGSNVPWFLVLPLVLLGTLALAVAVVLWDMRKWRWLLTLGGLAMLAASAALVVFEKVLNLSRFSQGGRQDIVLIVDVSTSMSLDSGGRTNLDRALEEVRDVLRRSPRGNAFSLILGGPTPSARVLIPTSDREMILRELDSVDSLSGGMAAYDCLTLAALALAQGSHPAKQILVFSDGQSVGWNVDQPARWAFLKEALENLPSTPKVVVREMPLPRQVRNLSIREITFSRRVIGTDRPVAVEVTVENTGSEAVSPGEMELTIGEESFTSRTLGQMLPGTTEVVRFMHQFEEPGAHALRVKLEVDDEIEEDDDLARAIQVNDRVNVLIVDGSFSGPFLERAGAFAALALAPGKQRQADEEEDVRYLVEPEVVSALQFSRMGSLDGYDAILLADVARFPGDTRQLIEDFVEGGGGLLVAPGERTDMAFYNAWEGRDGRSLLPARFQSLMVGEGERAQTLALDTFRHPALKTVSDERQSDLGTTSLSQFWKLEEHQGQGAVVGGRLRNGDPFLVTRRLGLGQVLLLATSLDLRGGNLPLRQAFVPFVHEMVYFLADPKKDELNLDPNWELVLHLSGDEEAFSGNGLKGEYFASNQRRKPLHTRYDPAIQFDWKGGSPASEVGADRFFVRWQGSIQPPVSGKYQFEAEVDDSVQVFVDGRNVLRQGSRGRTRPRQVWLDANRLHDIRVEYEEETGNATMILFWRGPRIPRQIVPPSAFRHTEGGDLEVLAEYPVLGPRDVPRRAVIEASRGGVAAKIQGDIAAGLYQIQVPSEERAKFGKLMREGAATLPFTVRRNPLESRLEPFSRDERSFLENYLGLVYPESPNEVLQILAGKSFGEELWRILAVAALLFLLVEVALTRWISISRRTGEDEVVSFG